MAIPSSQGGHVVIDGSPDIVVESTRWTGNWMARLAEVTTSGSGGGTRYASVLQDPQWSAEWPWDSVDYPVALGLTPGANIATMYFLTGNSGKCDQLTNTTVETVEKINDATADVPRVRATGRGGVVTLDASNPS